MKQLLTSFMCVALLAATSGCDKTGLNDLNEEIDILSQFRNGPGSTWVRSIDADHCPDNEDPPTREQAARCDPRAVDVDARHGHGPGTEVFIFDRDNVASNPSGTYLFMFGTVHDESTTHLEAGLLTIGPDGTGTAAIGVDYTFAFQPWFPSPLSRTGARRTEYDPPIERDIAIRTEGGQLVIEWGGLTRRATELTEVLDRIDVTTQAGAEDLFRATNIGFYMSNTRIIGFGSGGTANYTTPSDFAGVATGTYRIAVRGFILSPPIVTDITFTDVREMSGIVINGNQRTSVDLGGNGPAGDELNYTLERSADTVTYDILYEELYINDGAAGPGPSDGMGGTEPSFYTVIVNGTDSYVLDFGIAQEVHLRNVLPVSEGL